MLSRSYLNLCSRLIFFIVVAVGCLRAQDSPPAKPFQAVHLLWIDVQQPGAEDAVRSAITGLNQAITKAGCPECTYHLWKVVNAAQESYNYVQVSNWPSGTVYDKIHNSPEYIAASRNWEKLRSVVTREAYSRYTEIQLGNVTTARAAAAVPAEPMNYAAAESHGGLSKTR